ncbi:MAG: dihydroorotase [Acidimicrobiia bacterium]|nr:dihydroorotase [Acidimicrobiia bacterium]
MSDFTLRNAVVITGGGDHATIGDVAVVDGRIASIGSGIGIRGEAVDCGGAWLGPGFVDIHTHLREPGQEWKEDIETGSRAAAAGGYTAVVAMPNTDPAIDSVELARYVAARGAEVGLVEVAPSAAITVQREGRELAELEELCAAGVKLFTDDGDTVADAGLLRRAMEILAERDCVVAEHCIDPGLGAGGQLHEGEVSARLGLPGVPSAAEEIVIARDLALVRMTGARYHAQHVTTAGAVDLIAGAKEEGLPVTGEATPHHLLFDHSYASGADPVYKMMPPLRTVEDVAAVRQGLRGGVLDIVATDHAPHADHEKERPWAEAPFGVTGLEWAAAVVNTAVDLPAEDLFKVMSTVPAHIAGLARQGRLEVGAPANLVVFDPAAPAPVSSTLSRSSNSPYFGLELRGAIVHTIYEGKFTVRAGRLVGTSGDVG